MIDIRPRATQVASVVLKGLVLLEFKGRSFNASGNSAPNILASDESLLLIIHSILEELIEYF